MILKQKSEMRVIHLHLQVKTFFPVYTSFFIYSKAIIATSRWYREGKFLLVCEFET